MVEKVHEFHVHVVRGHDAGRGVIENTLDARVDKYMGGNRSLAIVEAVNNYWSLLDLGLTQAERLQKAFHPLLGGKFVMEKLVYPYMDQICAELDAA